MRSIGVVLLLGVVACSSRSGDDLGSTPRDTEHPSASKDAGTLGAGGRAGGGSGGGSGGLASGGSGPTEAGPGNPGPVTCSPLRCEDGGCERLAELPKCGPLTITGGPLVSVGCGVVAVVKGMPEHTSARYCDARTGVLLGSADSAFGATTSCTGTPLLSRCEHQCSACPGLASPACDPAELPTFTDAGACTSTDAGTVCP